MFQRAVPWAACVRIGDRNEDYTIGQDCVRGLRFGGYNVTPVGGAGVAAAAHRLQCVEDAVTAAALVSALCGAV